jgi:hypothetical protein
LNHTSLLIWLLLTPLGVQLAEMVGPSVLAQTVVKELVPFTAVPAKLQKSLLGAEPETVMEHAPEPVADDENEPMRIL